MTFDKRSLPVNLTARPDYVVLNTFRQFKNLKIQICLHKLHTFTKQYNLQR